MEIGDDGEKCCYGTELPNFNGNSGVLTFWSNIVAYPLAKNKAHYLINFRESLQSEHYHKQKY